MKNLITIDGAKILSKKEQKIITGGGSEESLCGLPNSNCVHCGGGSGRCIDGTCRYGKRVIVGCQFSALTGG